MTTKTVQFTKHAGDQIQTRFIQIDPNIESMVARVVERKISKMSKVSVGEELLVSVAKSQVKIVLSDGSNGEYVLAAVKVLSNCTLVKTVFLRRAEQVARGEHNGQKII